MESSHGENIDSGLGIIEKLKNEIKQLKHLNDASKDLNEEKQSEVFKKEYSLLSKIVNSLKEILSDNFIINDEQKQPKSDNEQNKNCFWDFISKHFNTPVVGFCKMFEKYENNEGNSPIQKAKNWIYFSILEKTFLDSINEIFNQKLDEIYYGKNAMIRKYKSEINKYLEELQQIQFLNIKSKDYEKYLEYLKHHQNIKPKSEEKFLEMDLKFGKSPILEKKRLNQKKRMSKYGEIILFDDDDEDDDDDGLFNKIIIKNKKSKENNDNEFKITKFTDFSPRIVDNFYNFTQQKEIIDDYQSDELENNISNNISNNNSFNKIFSEEELNLSSHKEELKKHKSDIILNPKISKHLPTDVFYEEYNNNENLLYTNNKKPSSNCISLYLNKYYKKAPYQKIYKHNLNKRPINLKDQNYQCYICLKRIDIFLNMPIEPVFLCSYYMKFVCKNCKDDEFSIIPHFIYKKWCFDKFPISKRGKSFLESWYDKPIIIFNKNNKLLYKIPQLYKVIKTKIIIRNMFDLMKCENRFKIIDEIFGEYDYLLLREIIFSMRDLVEINNKTFIKKINNFKDLLIPHLSGECHKCKFDGQICYKCGSEEKLFFYNNDEVNYCKKCNVSFHKKCLDFLGHIHLNKN